VAVVPAGPYASLHLAPEITTPAPHHSRFLQAGCPSCHQTNSVKALKVSWYQKGKTNLDFTEARNSEWQ